MNSRRVTGMSGNRSLRARTPPAAALTGGTGGHSLILSVLTWFRTRRSSLTVTVLLSLVVMGGSQLAPHPDDCHDTLCIPAVVAHDASAHRIGDGAVPTHDHQLHCLVCDWVRSFRPRAEAAFLPAPAPKVGAHVVVDVFTAALADLVAQPSLRGPPASPALV